MSLLKDYIKFRKYNLELLLEKGLDLEGKKRKAVEGGGSEDGAGVKSEGSQSSGSKRSREEEEEGVGGEVKSEGSVASEEKRPRVEEAVVKPEVN